MHVLLSLSTASARADPPSGRSAPAALRDIRRLNARDRALLERWVRASTMPQRTVTRSRIVLLLGEGLSGREVARRVGVSRHTVDLWRARYMGEGCDALTRDRPGRGRRPAAGAR